MVSRFFVIITKVEISITISIVHFNDVLGNSSDIVTGPSSNTVATFFLEWFTFKFHRLFTVGKDPFVFGPNETVEHFTDGYGIVTVEITVVDEEF
jgi:Gpi18-like mannosyltransferase